MDPILSVVLPVRNIEDLVADRIHDLLEVLAEITPRFELLVIDDSSTDQTDEIVHELLPHYPQLRLLRIDSRGNPQAALHAGFEHTRGEIIMLCDDDAPISSFEIRRLWELRTDDQLLVARSEPATDVGRPPTPAFQQNENQSNRANMTATESGGIQMVRRSGIQRLDPAERTNLLFPRSLFTHSSRPRRSARS